MNVFSVKSAVVDLQVTYEDDHQRTFRFDLDEEVLMSMGVAVDVRDVTSMLHHAWRVREPGDRITVDIKIHGRGPRVTP